MTTLKSFYGDLNREESQLIPVLASDNLGLLMRCAINELDWYYYNYSKELEPNVEKQEQLYIMQLGGARLIKLILENRESFDLPVVTTQRRPDLAVKVLSYVSLLGILQHGRRVAQTVASGVGEIEKTGPTEYTITLPNEIEDDDFYERSVLEYYNKESRLCFKKILHHENWKEIEKEVNSKLHDLVYPFMEHYIGYGADPILDDYFFGLASHELSLQEGYDTYHYSIKFGGISVQHYMLALTFLVSHSLRHERFAEALVEKKPEIKLENILTISADIDPFIQSLRDAVNHFGSGYEDFEEVNLIQATQIFNILTYSRENLDLIDPPGSPYPLSVKCSETGVILALFGTNTEPVRYLLESLRFHFREDYDINQASREASLQRATRRVLGEVVKDLDFLENIKMRLKGRVLSDIDLVALEKATGTIIFFQLKHQELYGSDLHAKSERNRRLKNQVKDWLIAVDSWMCASEIEEIKEALQLPRKWSQQIRVFKIIISRHYAYSLRGVVNGRDSAYANWLHFFNAIQLLKRDCSKPDLNNLFSLLQDIQKKPERVMYLPEPKTEWKMHELTYIITQETTECT